jgi:uncharacterized protein
MRCVKCEGTLVTVRIEDIDVDQCTRCAGIWFDAHELERVLGQPHIDPLLGHGARPGDDDRRGHCPRCGGDGVLVRVASRVAPIHVDTCAVCGGKWLDGGEIDRLRQKSFGAAVRRVFAWVLDLDLG